jgi:outer membrane receptor protein involved in Fe transport
MVNSPENLASAGFSTPTSRPLQGAVELIYESGRKTFAGHDTTGMFLTNLSLSAALRPQLRLSIVVKNLLDESYATPGGPALIQDTVPQDGRTFLVRLKVGG